jgi:hypothetical protein
MEEVRRGGDLARNPSSPSRDVRLSSELDEPRLKLFGASCVSAKSNRNRDLRGVRCTAVPKFTQAVSAPWHSGCPYMSE